MASVLGTLRVRLTAETEDFRRGLDSARARLGSFDKEIAKFRVSTLAGVASIGALTAVLGSSMEVANRYDNAQRQLAATAKLTGVEIGFLQATAKQAENQFRLSAISANGFTIELVKLAGKAGQMDKAAAGLESFLDIGAARGMDAATTLQRVKQAVIGLDEGTDALFNANPSVLHAEYAKAIGTTVGMLTDQQKATALLDRALTDGAKVRGEYQQWLQSSAGQQYLLSQSMEQTQAALGKSLQPALVAVLPVLSSMATAFQWLIKAVQTFGSALVFLQAPAQFLDTLGSKGLKAAREEFARTAAAFKESYNEIWNTDPQVVAPFKLDVGGTTDTTSTDAGKKAARQFGEGVAAEWENLRHSAALMRLEVGGTDSQRLAAEETHALNLLSIEEQQLRAEHRRKELTDKELTAGLAELEQRRKIAQARRNEFEAVQRQNAATRAGHERNAILLDDALAYETMIGRMAIEQAAADAKGAFVLDKQLGLVDRLYNIKRNALLTGGQLQDAELQNALLVLDLEREREQIQLRRAAKADAERKAIEKQRTMRDTLASGAANIGASIISGNATGASVGSQAGALGASMLEHAGKITGAMIPVVGAFLPAIGSLIGGMFGGKKKQKEQEAPVIKGLEAVERAQRETIATIEAQTDALLNPEQRLFNLPSGFNLPSYSPASAGGSTNVTYGDTNVTVQMTVTGGHSPDAVKDMVVAAITDALDTQMATQAWS